MTVPPVTPSDAARDPDDLAGRPRSGPLVSVLTPSLDQARFVEDCIRSVERQDYPWLEQVIVDGGSTDGTLELLRRREDERCRVLVVPGSSQAEALNAALAASHGEVIGWVNTDDAYFCVDAVSTAVARFREDRRCLVVYGDGAIADERGRVLRHVRASVDRLSELTRTSPLVQPAAFVRRDALSQRFVREDLELMLDHELWLYLWRRGRFCKVNRMLAIDRDRPGRKVRMYTERHRVELRLLAAEYGVKFEAERPRRGIPGAWRRRLSGVTDMLFLERRYRPAFRYVPDPRWRRLARQLLLPQHLLDRL